ncbi:MAG: type II toxin-antitoxin system RelE/ParE family toxin [Niveispirillum sp.]|nr:type II toxin-antitoxin system RelE/ParE family toxin [Niveispirillum sp.]
MSETALVDLGELAVRIAEDRGDYFADRYTRRLEAYCQSLCTFLHRGLPCPDIGTNLRRIGFERRVTVYFRVSGDQVIIARLLYAGRQP